MGIAGAMFSLQKVPMGFSIFRGWLADVESDVT